MPSHGRGRKQTKSHDLHNQPTEDNVLCSSFVEVFACLEAATSSLREKRHDVAKHEEACKPSWANDGESLAMDAADYSAECHINGGSEQCGCNKEQNALYDEWSER
jgi:hypothetical protein